MTEPQTTIVIAGASSGFGTMTTRTLADAGHVVYAGMRDTDSHKSLAAAEACSFAATHTVCLEAIEMNVSSHESVDHAVGEVLGKRERIDVVVHNAGQMVLGPLEASTPEQLIEIYDTKAVSTQHVNRAVLPHMRNREDGLLVWVGSSSTRGGAPPYLGPYFAATAAEDSIAVSCAAEVARFGIESVIVAPGSSTTGTNHFAHAGPPGRRPDRRRLHHTIWRTRRTGVRAPGEPRPT